jgi:hypothetical protein
MILSLLPALSTVEGMGESEREGESYRIIHDSAIGSPL